MKGKRKKYRKTMQILSFCCAPAMVAVLVGVSPVSAQDGNATVQSVLPTMVVTGEKIERTVRDTGASVSVLSADDLWDKSNVNSVADAIKDVPNVVFTDTVGAPVIRGQDTQGPNYGSTAFFGGTIPRATINLDGHYLNFYEYVYGGARGMGC